MKCGPPYLLFETDLSIGDKVRCLQCRESFALPCLFDNLKYCPLCGCYFLKKIKRVSKWSKFEFKQNANTYGSIYIYEKSDYLKKTGTPVNYRHFYFDESNYKALKNICKDIKKLSRLKDYVLVRSITRNGRNYKRITKEYPAYKTQMVFDELYYLPKSHTDFMKQYQASFTNYYGNKLINFPLGKIYQGINIDEC